MTSLLPDLLGTAPADLIAADITRPQATQEEARERLAEIKQMAPTFVRALRKISDAYACRDWEALGYASWKQYRDAEFGELLDHAVTKERREAVAELRAKGMSVRDIAAIVRASVSTVHDDIARCSGTEHLPGRVTGSDGKTYAATRPAPAPAPAPPLSAPAIEEPSPGDGQVWIAAARKGIEAHRLETKARTACGRSTRTGLTLPMAQAVARHEATRCRRCWPLAAEAHDPRASAEAGAQCRGCAPAGTTETAADAVWASADGQAAGSEAPAPADADGSPIGGSAPALVPPAASPAGGAGVTPVAEPRLTVDQIARLRAVFDWARAGLARHPRHGNAPTRGVPRVIGREYLGETAPRAPRGFSHSTDQVEHVEVEWDNDGEIGLTYRSDQYVIAETSMWVPGVDEALDVLCALGILPARLSRQYAAGVKTGLRRGAAIDGEALIEKDGRA